MQNGFVGSFNRRLPDECLSEHMLSSLAEARQTGAKLKQPLPMSEGISGIGQDGRSATGQVWRIFFAGAVVHGGSVRGNRFIQILKSRAASFFL